jgi:hypothetical protein
MVITEITTIMDAKIFSKAIFVAISMAHFTSDYSTNTNLFIHPSYFNSVLNMVISRSSLLFLCNY